MWMCIDCCLSCLNTKDWYIVESMSGQNVGVVVNGVQVYVIMCHLVHPHFSMHLRVEPGNEASFNRSW